MWLAANAPDRITRLALCCTAAYMPPASMWQDRAATARTEGLGSLVGPTTGRWFPAAFAQQHPEAVAPVAAMFTGTNPEGYAGCAEAIATMDQRESITSITAPTLVIAGAEDPRPRPGRARCWPPRSPGPGLTVVRGAAHLANYQTPGPVTAALAAHLAPLPG